MAILSAKTTEKFDAAAMKGVNQVLGKSSTAALGGAATRKTKPHDLAVPHDVYTLALNDFDKGLSGAKRTSLRYLVMSGSRAVAAAELERNSKSTAPKLSHINQGSLVSASLAALESAEQLPATQKDDFELRLLQIPAIHAIALWLHGKKNDLLIPLDPEIAESTGGAAVAAPLKPEKFFSSLKAQAELISGFDDSPGRSLEQTVTKSKRTNAVIKRGVKTTKKAVAKNAQTAGAKKVKKTGATKGKPAAASAKAISIGGVGGTVLINAIYVTPISGVKGIATKLGRVRTACLASAKSMGVNIVNIDQGLDVRLYADSGPGNIFDINDRVTFLQTDLKVAELKLVGAAGGADFAASALALAQTLADLGQNEGLWTKKL